MRKLFIMFTILFVVGNIYSYQLEMPKIHAGIMLDSKFYSGDHANSGDYNTTNRYQVRKAAFEVYGRLDEQISYSIEAGISTCVGAGTNLKLMNAVIEYEWNENITLALQQGHVLRGFSGVTECSDRIPLERPVFYTSMTTCHPTGFVANFYYDLPANTSIEFEAGLMNGTTETLDGEHDFNFGAIYTSPIPGLSVTGVYNHTSANYYIDGKNQSKDGNRIIAGLKYELDNLSLSGEYYTGEGFDTYDREYDAYYLLAAYRIDTNFTSKISYIQPYARYTFWDKAAEDDIDNQYTFLDLGINISLSSTTKLKLGYQKNLDQPEEFKESPSCLMARLQINI